MPKKKSSPVSDELRTLSPETQAITMLIAKIVRDALEDFHVAHLSDAQMRELNPIVRNAIATALHAIAHDDDPRVRIYLSLCRVPDYWEPPELLDDFLVCLDIIKPIS
jgi:hypothetical protein